ncbi:MAG TPA: hypothetical protein VLW52_13565 [Opitutaceae bacterium]|nr:hypothetical protein [Opitutaceae bacterium]
MKTLNSLLVVTAISLLLAAATVLRAGPPPGMSNRVQAIAKPAAPVKTAACHQAGQVCTNCQNCSGCPVKG